MTVKDAQWNTLKLAIAAVVAFLFTRGFAGKPAFWFFAFLELALVVAIGYIEYKYMRCPDCGRYLYRLPIDAENCPYCGATLE